jgi:hypothetical protein
VRNTGSFGISLTGSDRIAAAAGSRNPRIPPAGLTVQLTTFQVMTDIRYVILSDLHFGAENSLLTALNERPSSSAG